MISKIFLYKEKLLFFIILFIFLLVQFKDPFSERTLIPEFDPFPDSIYYVNPALSFLKGQGFYLVRKNQHVTPIVPILYSLILVPVFAIYPDPRMFYFTNVILALISLVLLKFILDKLSDNFWLKLFVLFLFITNPLIYYFPTLAMAENLLMPLFLAAVLLILQTPTFKIILGFGFLVISFYATKYAAFPLTISFFLIYLVKIVKSKIHRKLKLNYLVLYLAVCLGLWLTFEIYEYFFKHVGIFDNLNRFLIPFQRTTPLAFSSSTPAFSVQYISHNLLIYISVLTGGTGPLLGKNISLLETYITQFGVIGITAGLFLKEYRLLAISLLTCLTSSILFISTFYTTDTRYILIIIPVLLIGLSLFLSILNKISEKPNRRKYFYFFVILLFLFYMATNLIGLKKQIMLNLKYAETPWTYVGVKNLNSYFIDSNSANNEESGRGKKPFLITALAPYRVDFYSNGNYELLPLSKEQDWWSVRENVWGDYDYTDLNLLYKNLLSRGDSLYLTNSGLGNEGYLYRSFNQIKENFKVTKVKDGCFDTCVIYKVEIKNEKKI